MKLPYLKSNGKYILKEFIDQAERKELLIGNQRFYPLKLLSKEDEAKRAYEELVNPKPQEGVREYDELYFFVEGMARAKKDEKWFYIDQNENIIETKRRYVQLKDFYRGIAMVKAEDGAWYFINKNGTEVNKRPYLELHTQHKSYYSTEVGFYDGFGAYSKRYLIDLNGNEMNLDYPRNPTDLKSYSTNYSWPTINDGIILVRYSNKIYRAFDHSGMEIFKTDKCSYITEFNEGRAIAFTKDGEAIIIDTKLNEKRINTDIDVDSIERGFCEGYCLVQRNGKWGYLNVEGEYICEFEGLSSMQGGFAIVSKKIEGELKYSFINSSLKEVIPYTYDFIQDFSEGVTAVQMNGKWGFVDSSGKEIVVPQFTLVGKCKNGFMPVSIGDYKKRYLDGQTFDLYYGKYGFYNKSGKKICPLIYDRVDNFSPTGAIVKLNGHYGLINTNGEETTKIQYDYIEGYLEGCYFAYFEDKRFVIDNTGYQFSEGCYERELNESGDYFFPF